jgi:hypothetical protein
MREKVALETAKSAMRCRDTEPCHKIRPSLETERRQIMIELTLDMAEPAAKAALAKAKQLGTVMTASVVDESGRTVLIMRGDTGRYSEK